jgi:hypothetical protein
MLLRWLLYFLVDEQLSMVLRELRDILKWCYKIGGGKSRN